MRSDVAHGHPSRVERDDVVVEALQPPLMLAHQLRLKRPHPVARPLDPHLAVLATKRLRARPVASVTDPARRSLPRHRAETIGQLGRQRPLHQSPRQPIEQPVPPGDLLPAARTSEQLVDQLIRELLRHATASSSAQVVGASSPRVLSVISIKASSPSRPHRLARPGPAWTENRTVSLDDPAARARLHQPILGARSRAVASARLQCATLVCAGYNNLAPRALQLGPK
jgi:hypothetical protein